MAVVTAKGIAVIVAAAAAAAAVVIEHIHLD